MKIPILSGPTSVGKSETAISLSEASNGGIVIADTVQIYDRFDIGSGKPTRLEQKRGNYHLVGAFDALQNTLGFSTYANSVRDSVSLILQNSQFPIIEGGSTLFLSSIQRNQKRIFPKDSTLQFFGFYREIDEIEQRIRTRLEQMFSEGLIEENQQLLKNGYANTPPYKNGICYKEVQMYLLGKITFDEMRKLIVKNALELVNAQFSYLERVNNILWLNLSENSAPFERVNFIADNLGMESPLRYDNSQIHSHELIHGLSSLFYITKNGLIEPNRNGSFNTHYEKDIDGFRYATKVKSKSGDDFRLFHGDKIRLLMKPSKKPKNIKNGKNNKLRFYWDSLSIQDVVKVQILPENSDFETNAQKLAEYTRKFYPLTFEILE